MRFARSTLPLLPLLLGAILPAAATAQETNYWSQQYGTRSKLLGGVVVGNLSDISATYYNPGMLALVPNPTLLLTAKSFNLTTYSLEPPSGGGSRLSSTGFSPAPTFWAGTLPFHWLGGDVLGYSVLRRFDFNVRMTGRLNGDHFEGSDIDNFAAELFVDLDLTENWFGATWAHRQSDWFGYGVTGYVAYRGQKSRRQMSIEGVNSGDGGGVNLLSINDFDYYNYRALAKLGAGFDFDDYAFGFTVTTPSLNLFGSGSSYITRSVNGLDPGGEGGSEARLISMFDQDVSSEYKSSAAIAVGGGYRMGQVTTQFTAELFSKVDPYAILDTDSYEVTEAGDTITNDVVQSLKEVLNIGVGVQYRYTERVGFYGGVIIDNSAADNDTHSFPTVSSVDIYHLVSGTAFHAWGSAITLGLGYSWGNGPLNAGGALYKDDVMTGVANLFEGSSVDYRNLEFILGFEFPVHRGSGSAENGSRPFL